MEGSSRRAAVALSILLTGACSGSSAPSTPTASVSTISVAGTPPALGSSSQFSAVAVFNNNSTVTVTSQATWQSSNPSVATVSGAGNVTAVAAGPVQISASYSNVVGSLTFTVAQTFVLRGVVSDSTTGLPVAGATVSATDRSGVSRSTASDGSGAYQIPGLAIGGVTVTATAAGYLSFGPWTTGDTTLSVPLTPRAPCPAIGFDDLLLNGVPFTTTSACGFTVTATTGNWTAQTSTGLPAPSIQFQLPSATTTIGEISVTAGGAQFGVQSVDLYSGMTIAYVMTGLLNSTAVLTIQGTQDFRGNFVTITNRNPAARVDTLVIRLSNLAASFFDNQVRLDNIRLQR
jgi:hypothetical protein